MARWPKKRTTEVQQAAAHCRARATHYRETASLVVDPDARDRMLKLASEYDQLVVDLEAMEPLKDAAAVMAKRGQL
jgi:hypothetical protein